MYCFHSDWTGISTGVFEVRADGTFHEWTIFNQHPAGAAKIQIMDDMFMALRTEVHVRTFIMIMCTLFVRTSSYAYRSLNVWFNVLIV